MSNQIKIVLPAIPYDGHWRWKDKPFASQSRVLKLQKRVCFVWITFENAKHGGLVYKITINEAATACLRWIDKSTTTIYDKNGNS